MKTNNLNEPEFEKYAKDYDEKSFWEKAKKSLKSVGYDGMTKALELYYALDNPELPTKTKAIIYGALGYFISPLDFIPDFTPVLGFSDDIAMLATAIFMVNKYIDDIAKAKARALLDEWFG